MGNRFWLYLNEIRLPILIRHGIQTLLHIFILLNILFIRLFIFKERLYYGQFSF